MPVARSDNSWRSSATDKNQYVHRRDSVSLMALSEMEIQQRIRLGLVTASQPQTHNQYDDLEDNEEMDEWEDFDLGEDNAASTETKDSSEGGVDNSHLNSYRLSDSRRSSVDLSSMSSNLHDIAASDLESQLAAAARMVGGSLGGSFSLGDEKRHRQSSVGSMNFEPIDETEADEEEVME